ncbi:MAG: hypothetical protein JSW51_02270 [Gemmatimonadota bacterium]|nr:MAG: hypothetical protein JSW51_02270 [Gemmatimonadota bacterium]
MRRSKLLTGLATSLIVVMAGCGGDGDLVGVDSGDPLSDAEIQTLFNELGSAIGSIGAAAQQVVSAQDGPMRAPAGTISVNQSIDESAACESGTLGVKGKVEGTVDDETFETDMIIDFTLNFNSCMVSNETISITLDNPPGIAYYLDMDMGQESYTISGSQKGGFSFTTSDDRMGSCAIDLTFDLSYDAGTGQSNVVSGTVCGRSAADFQPYTGT